MALGESGFICAQDHGYMGKLRKRISQGLVEEDLPGSIVHMIISADYVGDAHGGIVHYHAEVIGGPPIAAQENQIIHFRVVKLDGSFDQVVEKRLPFLRGLETNGRCPSRNGGLEIAAGSVVLRFPFLLQSSLALLFQLFRRTVAGVGFSSPQKPLGMIPVDSQTVRLIDRPLIPIQTQPGQAFQDGIDGFFGGTYLVRILNA
jgi:hypothetical protein